MNSMPAEQPTPGAPVGPGTEKPADTLRSYVESVNIAEKLDDDVIKLFSNVNTFNVRT